MTDPKPVRMWAVVDHTNRIVTYPLRSTKKQTMNAAANNAKIPWEAFEAAGYTVRRVTITPDPESEK